MLSIAIDRDFDFAYNDEIIAAIQSLDPNWHVRQLGRHSMLSQKERLTRILREKANRIPLEELLTSKHDCIRELGLELDKKIAAFSRRFGTDKKPNTFIDLSQAVLDIGEQSPTFFMNDDDDL